METSKLNWQLWLKQGDQYFKAATPKSSTSRFDTVVRYNLISMSLEGYIMAILDFHQKMPENHTYIDLITALETVMPIDEVLKNRILQYESIQSICSIDKFHIAKPTEEEIFDLKGAISEISILAHNTCIAAA
jgi:hypothetical protein